jgi:hypothetical protein
MSFTEALAVFGFFAVGVVVLLCFALRRVFLWYWHVDEAMVRLTEIRDSLLRLELSAAGGQQDRAQTAPVVPAEPVPAAPATYPDPHSAGAGGLWSVPTAPAPVGKASDAPR